MSEIETNIDQELQDMYATLDAETDGLEPPEADGEKEAETEDIDNSEDVAEDEIEQADDTPPSSEEDVASTKGWVPKDQFTGDPSEWVDAAEFNRRAPLFEKISKQNKQLKSLKKQMDALAKHTKTVAERTREKTIAELKQQQRDAVAMGDLDAFEQAEKALGEAQKDDLPEFETDELDAPDSQSAPQEIPPAVKEFAARNSWFEKDPEMTKYMLFQVEQVLAERQLPFDQAIAEAEKAVKQTFAHKFRNPKKDKPSPVMSGNRGQERTGKSISSLTPEQRQVWHALKGTMTEKEFLDQLETIS